MTAQALSDRPGCRVDGSWKLCEFVDSGIDFAPRKVELPYRFLTTSAVCGLSHVHACDSDL